MAYIDPNSPDGSGPAANFETNMQQQLDFEGFFQFAKYTNTNRTIGKDEDGNNIKVPSYQPGLDLVGPSNWLPQQCYTSVDYKYASPVIGYIKNGNQLEEDLLKQIKDIFVDQQSIAVFADKIVEFLAKLNLGGKKDKEEGEGAEKEEGGGGLGIDDSNIFKLDPDLAQTTGGQYPSPH